MNDLLGSLPAAAAAPPGNGAAAANALGDGRGGDAVAFDVEQGSPYGGAPAVAAMTAPTTPADAAMASFFASVDEINNDVERIKVLQGSVVDLHEAGKTLIKTKDVKNHQSDMQVGHASGWVRDRMALQAGVHVFRSVPFFGWLDWRPRGPASGSQCVHECAMAHRRREAHGSGEGGRSQQVVELRP
eukprot:363493-Chlamydomonas_euryale.AAC.5